MMKRLLIFVAFVVALAGCSNIKKIFHDEKVKNRREWYQARAKIIYGVGMEHLKAGSFDKARSSAIEAIRLDPDYVPARVLLAKVLLEDGDYAAAIEQLRRAEAISPGDAEVAYLLGQAFERRGQFAQALKQYQKARALDPAKNAYILASANVLVLMGKTKEAMELLDLRLSRTIGNPAMLLFAGEIAMLNHLPEKAADFFRRCLDQQPNSLTVRESLAKAEFFAHHYADALTHLKVIDQQIRKMESSKQSESETYQSLHREKKSWVYLMMGDCYMAMNQPWRARRSYEKACQIAPNDWRIWLNLAKANIAIGPDYLQDAIISARRALALNDQSIEAAVILANALLHRWNNLGQARSASIWQDAMEVIVPLMRKHPNDPILWCMLGRCYDVGGFPRKATACYLSALRIDPNNSLAKSILSKRTIPAIQNSTGATNGG